MYDLFHEWFPPRDQQTILLRSQPNKLMSTLLTEVFGYETLQHFNYSTLPTKARDAVIGKFLFQIGTERSLWCVSLAHLHFYFKLCERAAASQCSTEGHF